MKNKKIVRALFDFDAEELDEVIKNFDINMSINSFTDANLREGSWSLEIQIPNNSQDKKKLFPVLKFCQQYKIAYQLVNKNQQFYILKFIPSSESLVQHFPSKAVAILNQYLIQPKENAKRIKIEVPESEFSHSGSNLDEAVAFIMDDVEGNSGKLPIIKKNSDNERNVSDYPDIRVEEDLEFDEEVEIIDAEVAIVNDDELI